MVLTSQTNKLQSLGWRKHWDEVDIWGEMRNNTASQGLDKLRSIGRKLWFGISSLCIPHMLGSLVETPESQVELSNDQLCLPHH